MWWVYLAPQNIPSAIVLTFGNIVILYCIVCVCLCVWVCVCVYVYVCACVVIYWCFWIGVNVWWVYLAPQNIPSAIVLTLGNIVILYCIVCVRVCVCPSHWMLLLTASPHPPAPVSACSPTSCSAHLAAVPGRGNSPGLHSCTCPGHSKEVVRRVSWGNWSHHNRGHNTTCVLVSRCGPAVRRQAGQQKDLGLIPLQLSFLFQKVVVCGHCLVTLSIGHRTHKDSNYPLLNTWDTQRF